MDCVFCGTKETEVVESRVVESGKAIRRRRECGKCHRRFTTFERARESLLWVVKKDGRREPFDKEKLRRGILRAIVKRPVSLAQVDMLVDEVEREMMRKGEDEIPSRVIGSAVLKHLRKIDKVSWLRFASVYLEFENLDDFEKVIIDKSL